MKSNKIFVIVGPTCTGKTALGIRLAEKFGGSIISADSRQAVKYMDIGTGKLPADHTRGDIKRCDGRWSIGSVDIYGYDLVDPDEYFSAFDFKRYFARLALNLVDKEKTVFLVGGTGFYIDAATGRTPLSTIGPNPDLRSKLEGLALADLRRRLKTVDREGYDRIDRNNRARLIRAIEKAEALGSSDAKVSESSQPLLTSAVFLGLTTDREALYHRADKWVDTVFGEALFNEVKFIKQNFPVSHRLKGLIYKTATQHLDGRVSLSEAIKQAKFDMHAYIRRQQTYFKKNKAIIWFDITKDFDSQVVGVVESELGG